MSWERQVEKAFCWRGMELFGGFCYDDSISGENSAFPDQIYGMVHSKQTKTTLAYNPQTYSLALSTNDLTLCFSACYSGILARNRDAHCEETTALQSLQLLQQNQKKQKKLNPRCTSPTQKPERAGRISGKTQTTLIFGWHE